MEDEKTIAECGVESETTLILIVSGERPARDATPSPLGAAKSGVQEREEVNAPTPSLDKRFQQMYMQSQKNIRQSTHQLSSEASSSPAKGSSAQASSSVTAPPLDNAPSIQGASTLKEAEKTSKSTFSLFRNPFKKRV